jgi:hypothetical protein
MGLERFGLDILITCPTVTVTALTVHLTKPLIMNLLKRSFCYATLIGLAAANAQADPINGYAINSRVFNNDPGSTLVITPPTINFNPATFNIHDQYSGPFSGANRHDILASSDGGATAHTFGIDDSFTFTTRLTLTAGANSPRKEAGIRFNSSIGDMLFLVNSDAGEIVTFGGPFHLFGNNAGGNGYTPGTSILLGVRETGGGDGIGGIPDTIEFFIDRGSGIVTTGPLAWSNLEGGLPSFTVGTYVQGDANANGDFINGLFTDTTFTTVPEPGTFSLIALGVAGMLAIRRKR